nr:probable glucuronosyltransferase GUT1 [Tanacetum cinerariifolium]
LSQMPYFRLSGGRDHIFVFPSGAGAHLFKSWATYINRSIILTPEGDRTDKRDTSAFNTWKDIIIPGNVDDGMTSNGVKLLESPELKFSGTEKLGKTDYFLHLRNAKFCLAPRGE